MSVLRIIVSIVLVTHCSNANVFLGKDGSGLPLGPYYDTRGDYYVEEPLLETLAEAAAAEEQAEAEDAAVAQLGEATGEDNDTQDADYGEMDWDHDTGISERHLPINGELKLMQDKKSQTLCKVRKVIRHLREPGYEFFPKSYSEYDCVRHSNFDGISQNSIINSEVCYVRGSRCVTMQKHQRYMKRKIPGDCWTIQKEITNAGCNCLLPNLS